MVKSKNVATRRGAPRSGCVKQPPAPKSFGMGPSTRSSPRSLSAIAIGSGPIPTPDFTAYSNAKNRLIEIGHGDSSDL